MDFLSSLNIQQNSLDQIPRELLYSIFEYISVQKLFICKTLSKYFNTTLSDETSQMLLKRRILQCPDEGFGLSTSEAERRSGAISYDDLMELYVT